MWLPKEFAGSITSRMTFGSIISGALGCGIWCFAMIWVDRIRMPKELQMSLLLRILLIIAGVTMSYLGMQSLIAYFS